MDEEQVVGANIEKLTRLLNDEFTKAHALGLKVQVVSNDAVIMMTPQPRRLSVRVWRETVLVGERDSAKTLRL